MVRQHIRRLKGLLTPATGPAFFNYSQVMNNAISSGSMNATKLTMGSLLIINGILDEAVQAPFFPIMASQNTYGIKAVNDTVYNYMVFANSMLNGCQDQVAQCREVDISTAAGQAICSEATCQFAKFRNRRPNC